MVLRCINIREYAKMIMNIARTKYEKSRLVLTVQAFCEEKGLRSLSGVLRYAESKNQCWQADKWRLHHLICIFSKCPPN